MLKTTDESTDGVGVLSSSFGTPSDDVTLSTADAIFRYEIGELKMKKFHAENPNFENEIIAESIGDEGSAGTDYPDVQAFVTYTWIIRRPSIAHFNSDNKLYFRISAHPQNITKTEEHTQNRLYERSPYSESQNSFFRSRNYHGFQPDFVESSYTTDLDNLVTLEITFSPCPAASCVHGSCVVQHGDVQSSSCVCR